MVRNYKRKTTRGDYGSEMLGRALQAIKTGMPINQAGREFGVPPRVIRRHRDKQVASPGECKLGRHRTILSGDIEKELHDHVVYMEKSLYGLTTRDIRKLAFEIAEKFGLQHPFNQESKMAGKGWLTGFLSRHQDISIREPEGTNLSRAVAFNKPKVQEFFTVYRQLLEVDEFTPSRIWNMDETGITNVHKPKKILATKGVRSVGKVTSGERGKTVTVICAINAAGVYLPPMLIFPRRRMIDALMTGAPPQSIGCCSPSGWTDSQLFMKWLEHFVAFTNASPEVQQIIVLDGHHSHKTLTAVMYARQHGIHLLTLPPHSTHKMQPLDRTYFKSLKSAYNAAADSWMVSNPGKRISFYEMAGIFGKAYLRSATIEKAINGFAKCGIWPFDQNVFSDIDYLASAVTDESYQPLQPTDQEGSDNDSNPPSGATNFDSTTTSDDESSSGVLTPENQSYFPTGNLPVLSAENQPVISSGNSPVLSAENQPVISSGNPPVLTPESQPTCISGNPPVLSSENQPVLSGNPLLLPSENQPIFPSGNPLLSSQPEHQSVFLPRNPQIFPTGNQSTLSPLQHAGNQPGPCDAIHLIPDAIPSTSSATTFNNSSSDNQKSGFNMKGLIRSLSPLPKLSTVRPRKRKSEGATLLTSSPYKTFLQEKEDTKRAKNRPGEQKRNEKEGCPKGASKGRGKGKKKAKKGVQTPNDSNEWPCLICAEPFANSKSREVWVQCSSCEGWAHEDCTDGNFQFTCPNCLSD